MQREERPCEHAERKTARCVTHQEGLCVKTLKTKHVMSTATPTVNFT